MLPRPANQQDQEDTVLASLMAQLASAGLGATLVENPDRLPAAARRVPDLTSDGLIRVNGTLWSVDVMSVAAPVDLFVVSEMLQDRLLPLAEQFGVGVLFSGVLPAKSSVDAVVAAVGASMAGGVSGSCVPSPKFTVEWEPGRAGVAPRVEVLASLDESSLLSDQIEVAIEKALAKKATVQARPARLAGCGTAVALDQVGHSEMKAGTQWLPKDPHTFRVAVETVLARLPSHSLDTVLLHDQNGDWHVLTGAFPGLQGGP